MKVPLILFILLLQVAASGQSKLKYTITKESGDTVFYTNDEKLYVSAGNTYGSGTNKQTTVGDYLKSSVLKNAGGYVLEFAIQTGSTNSFSIYNGNAAKLIMADGSSITLYSRADYSSKKSSMGYGSWIFAFYTLPDGHMETVKSGTINAIRIETSGGNFDYPLKEKFRNIISGQLKSFE